MERDSVSRTLDRVNVLIVDDSAAVRGRLVAMLREVVRIMHIDEAASVDEALVLVTDRSHDVVVLDLRMPGKIGLSVVAHLKGRAVPPLVIILTNEATELHKRECFAQGADFFFDKSKHFDRVVEALLDPARARAKYPSGSGRAAEPV